MNKENWIAVRKSSLYDYFNLPPQAKEQAERTFDGMLKSAKIRQSSRLGWPHRRLHRNTTAFSNDFPNTSKCLTVCLHRLM